MGDTRAFPEHIRGDVDIAVAQAALHQIPQLLARFCQREKLQLSQVLHHELTAWYYTLAWRGADGRMQFLNTDICGDYYHIGRYYLSSDELLRNRTPAIRADGSKPGFQVAAPTSNFAYYLIKKIDKQDLSPEHGSYLSEQWHRDPEGAEKQIQRFWPEPEARLLAAAAKENRWEPITARLPHFQQALRGHRPFSPVIRVREFARKAERALNPAGLLVAVIGPDGCGKSSVINEISASLVPSFRRTHRFHLRPGLLKQSSATAAVVVNPHAQTPYGTGLSILKLLYLWFDYTAGYWCKVYPRLAFSTLVLFDRYYHDLLVDPRRYRFGGPLWLARCIGRLLPQPDLWILLDAPVDVLQQRKQEVSREETARQRNAYLELAGSIPSAVVIDASRELNCVIGDVEQAVINVLSKQTQQRLAIGTLLTPE